MQEIKRRKLIKLNNYPELLAEFDYSKNKLIPEYISHKSGIKVHWRCKYGHEWVDSVAHRTVDKRSCPFCNNRKLWKGFNDFKTKYPQLAKEWNYKKNDLSPSDYLYTCSKIKVWWICPICGHEYQMTPRDRGAERQGCPICAHKKISNSFNKSLEYKFPELVKEWNYEKNGNRKPSEYYPNSNKKVWWKCEKGHEWEASISNRTKNGKGTGCPVCSNKKIIKGINDLFTKRPDLEKYWDFNKNKISPYTIPEKSNRNAYWICDKGHSFSTKVYLMTIGNINNICPICSNRKVVDGVNDLATTYPELLKEWDYSKNKCLPTQIHALNNKKYWWKCEKGHGWSASVYSRTHNKRRCPYCTNQKLMKGYNDLATLYPRILEYWDYSKNKTKPTDFIGLHSNARVWLKCKNNHSWETRISDFTKGAECPICKNRVVLKGFNDLTTTHPSLCEEWNCLKNIKKPYDYTYGSHEKIWWICKKGHEWKATINSRAKGNGCPFCAKEKQCSLPEKVIYYYVQKYFKDALENVHLKEIHLKELDIFVPSLKLAVEYDGHNWHKNTERDFAKDELCKEAGIRLIRIREANCPTYNSGSIKIYCPDIHNNAYLLKDAIHTLFLKINELYNLKIKPKINIETDYSSFNELLVTGESNKSLARKFPEIAKEWNFERNKGVTPNQISYASNKRVWWKCKNGHEWLAVVGTRTGKHKNGCPYCSNKKVLKGYNDLETLHPELAAEWHPTKNGALEPSDVCGSGGSHKKVWWICPSGHEYIASLGSRIRLHTGCNKCAINRRKNKFNYRER